MRINWALLWTELPNLLAGAGLTLFITFVSLCVGTTLGLAVAILRLSRRAWLRLPAACYVEAFRGTPMLVQILLIHYGIIPGLQQDVVARFDFLSSVNLIRISPVYSGIVALGLNSAAYLGEIFRGGIQSIDRGQREAALSLGMTEPQVMIHVVLPQALANALPSICNEFITLIKDSSLAAWIAVAELTYRAQLVGPRTLEYFTMYAGIAILYFIMTFATSRLLARLERRLRTGFI